MGEPQFVRTRLGAGEDVRPELKRKFARQRPRDELGLVVTAFAEARRVKWYWDDDIGGELFEVSGRELRKAAREPGRKRGDAIMLYEQNGADHRIVVVGKAAREAEAVSFEAAETAKKLWHVRDLK
jgi:hypothetical protein